MIGRILPIIVLILPFWLIRVFCKTRDTLAVWPGLLVCGITFGGIQFFWSNFMDAALVDILGGIGTLLVLAFFFGRVWQPRTAWRMPGDAPVQKSLQAKLGFGKILLAWSPFLLLALFVVLWGAGPVTKALDKFSWKQPVPGLHLQVIRMPPVVPKQYAESAIFDISWLSTVGTGTFILGVLPTQRKKPRQQCLLITESSASLGGALVRVCVAVALLARKGCGCLHIAVDVAQRLPRARFLTLKRLFLLGEL